LIRSFLIPVSSSVPRDLRGQLLALSEERTPPAIDSVRLLLPGTVCGLALTPDVEKIQFRCVRYDKTAEEDEGIAWFFSAGPMAYDLAADIEFGRNFFKGKLYGESGWRKSLDPFYEAAILLNGNESNSTVFASTDGRTKVYNDETRLIAAAPGLGSTIVSAFSRCDNKWKLLAAKPTDWTEPDAVTAYEISGGEFKPVSLPVEFDGPVLSLTPEAVMREQGPKDLPMGTIAVVQNLATGKYEAYSLTISCGH
jgi:hypothetical protein